MFSTKINSSINSTTRSITICFTIIQNREISIFSVENLPSSHAWKEDCRIQRRAIFHHRFHHERKRRRCTHTHIYICTNEIFIFAGADARRESRMGGTVRATDVQRWRGHVSYDSAEKATRRNLLEACSRNYQRFFGLAEENRPHFRPLCRHGDSFLGPEEIVSVSVRNSLLSTLFFFFFVEINR